MMLALLAAAALAAPIAVDFEPTDDLWVYPHATDPQKDPYLRVWGTDGKAVAARPEDSDAYSYSYMKFDVSTLPKGKVTAATLHLTHTADPSYPLDYSKKNPLQVRPVLGEFSEKTWNYDSSREVAPTPEDKTVYGAWWPEKQPEEGKLFPVVIDLHKGPNDLRKAIESGKPLAFALTSSVSPEEYGMKAVYKVFSKDAETKANRPYLRITVEQP